MIRLVKGGNRIDRMATAFAVILATWLWLPDGSVAAEANPPVARVNDAILCEADLQRALNEIMPAGIFHGGFSSQKRMSYRPKAMEKMIEKELFFQEAMRIGTTVDDQALEDEKARVVKRLGGRQAYAAALKQTGISEERHLEVLKKKLTTEAFVQREIKRKAIASEQDVRNYFNAHRQKFKRPEARRLRHILISVKPSAGLEQRNAKKDLARQILEKILAGEDMAVLAEKYSNDRYRIKGGDYGLVHSGRLTADLEKVVFRLKLNETSGLIESMYGFHIARVEEIKPPEQLDLEDVFGKIQKNLTRENEKRITRRMLDKLRAAASIDYF